MALAEPNSSYADAMDRAVKLLAARPRSVAEISIRLATLGYAQDAIKATVTRLTELGVLNDSRLAVDEATKSTTERPMSPEAVRQQLRRRGVDDTVIEEALQDAGTEEGAALEAARRKARTYASLPWPVASRRLTAFLARRGFKYDVSADACRQALEEVGVRVPD